MNNKTDFILVKYENGLPIYIIEDDICNLAMDISKDVLDIYYDHLKKIENDLIKKIDNLNDEEKKDLFYLNRLLPTVYGIKENYRENIFFGATIERDKVIQYVFRDEDEDKFTLKRMFNKNELERLILQDNLKKINKIIGINDFIFEQILNCSLEDLYDTVNYNKLYESDYDYACKIYNERINPVFTEKPTINKSMDLYFNKIFCINPYLNRVEHIKTDNHKLSVPTCYDLSKPLKKINTYLKYALPECENDYQKNKCIFDVYMILEALLTNNYDNVAYRISNGEYLPFGLGSRNIKDNLVYQKSLF